MDKDRALVCSMLDLHIRTRGPAKQVIDLWLVNRAKRFWPRFAGLKGLSRTNVPKNYTLLAMHHPAQLCWEWSWSISFNRRDTRWRSPKNWLRISKEYGQSWLVVPFLFCLRYHRQSYDSMLSRAAEQRLREYAFAEEMAA